MSVRELRVVLHVTTTAVREQVNRLARDGWLDRTRRRGHTGRPADVFALSARAKRVFGGQLAELSRFLARAVFSDCDPGQARSILRASIRGLLDGKQGEDKGDATPGERLVRLAASLRADGDVVEIEDDGRSLRLKLFTCPYGELVRDLDEVCEIERDVMSEITGGRMQLLQRKPDGHACCELGISGGSARACATAQAGSSRRNSADEEDSFKTGDAV